MAIRKPKPEAAPSQWKQRQKLVEEYAALDKLVAEFKPKLFRHEKLRRLILDWYPDTPGDEEITVSGMESDIVISSRDQIRTVSPEGKQKLWKLWGQREFIARATVLLKSLPDPEDAKGLYTVQALAGPRHLHVAARVKAAQAA
jgi:hypothetical protein